jgi:hypothetical protein
MKIVMPLATHAQLIFVPCPDPDPGPDSGPGSSRPNSLLFH